MNFTCSRKPKKVREVRRRKKKRPQGSNHAGNL
jgi:hypothetical protein